MRVTALEVTATTAVVELRPCWLARMLGARVVHVGLARLDDKRWALASTDTPLVKSDGFGGWHENIPNGMAMHYALDFRPAIAPPMAKAVQR